MKAILERRLLLLFRGLHRAALVLPRSNSIRIAALSLPFERRIVLRGNGRSFNSANDHSFSLTQITLGGLHFRSFVVGASKNAPERRSWFLRAVAHCFQSLIFGRCS